MLVNKRYIPGRVVAFFDDFIEPPSIALSGKISSPKDGSSLELCKYYLISACAVCGRGALHEGLQNLLMDCASLMETADDNDLFMGRQRSPVAFAIRQAIGAAFQPIGALASLYLATQFEFYFRILSGLLNADGTWKTPQDYNRAKLLLPNERLSDRGVSSVEIAFKLTIAHKADSRARLLAEVDASLKDFAPSALYDNLGGRIRYMRNRGAHGEWGDLSAECLFFSTLTAILFFASSKCPDDLTGPV